MESIKDIKLVHIVKRSDTKTMCGMRLKDILKYKWMHQIEAYKKELIIHKKEDIPTCQYCIKILELYGIKTKKELIDEIIVG